jgi:hypothetical protein
MALPISTIAGIIIAGTTVVGSAAVVSMRHPAEINDPQQVQQVDTLQPSQLPSNVKVIPPTTAPVPTNTATPLPTVPGNPTTPPSFGNSGNEDDDDSYGDDDQWDDDSDDDSWGQDHHRYDDDDEYEGDDD